MAKDDWVETGFIFPDGHEVDVWINSDGSYSDRGSTIFNLIASDMLASDVPDVLLEVYRVRRDGGVLHGHNPNYVAMACVALYAFCMGHAEASRH